MNASPFRNKALLVLLAIAIPLMFAAYTQHVWEDGYITLRSSRNLVEGHGLVFTPGERVHAFTSPLGVLLPALCYWIAGPHHEALTFWLFRVISVSFLAAGMALAWDRLKTLGAGSLGRTLFFGLVLADAKVSDFATDGMETGLLLCLVLWLWSELERPERPRIWVLGAAIGLLEWTRPDAFVLAGALLLPHLVARSGSKATLPFSQLMKAIGLSVALYAPWFLWAWAYYGSPIPNTIIAKMGVFPPRHAVDLLLTPLDLLQGMSNASSTFLPAYWQMGRWPELLMGTATLFCILSAFLWIAPFIATPARRVSFTFFVGAFYLNMIEVFPWYTPPWLALGALAIALATDQAWKASVTRGFRPVGYGLWVLALFAIGLQAWVFVGTCREMKVQQTVIEDGIRTQIGLWLHDHADPKDTVFLEPLGYIGYYSNLKMLDFPGLGAPEVVALVRKGVKRFPDLIGALQPTWLVLRPGEFPDPASPTNAFLRDYEPVRSWDRSEELRTLPWLPCRGLLLHDSAFTIYRRKTPAS